MKYFIIIITFSILINCHSKEVAFKKKNKKIITHESLLPFMKTFNGLWHQYKKDGAIPNDTVPNQNCYVRISTDTFYYMDNMNIQYLDFLIRDTSFEYPVYHFKNHTQNSLHILTKDYKEILLKKYANEGDYEYFRRISS